MQFTEEQVNTFKNKFPGCKIAGVSLKSSDGNSVELETLVRSPDRQVISEAEKFETTNPGKAKEIYVRNCVLSDVEKVMADDNLFYQAYFAITDLLPFQKPDMRVL